MVRPGQAQPHRGVGGAAHLPLTQVSDGLQRPSSNRQPAEEDKRERTQCHEGRGSSPRPRQLRTPGCPRNKAAAPPTGSWDAASSRVAEPASLARVSERTDVCVDWFPIGRTLEYSLSLPAAGQGRLPKDTLQSSGGSVGVSHPRGHLPSPTGSVAPPLTQDLWVLPSHVVPTPTPRAPEWTDGPHVRPGAQEGGAGKQISPSRRDRLEGKWV